MTGKRLLMLAIDAGDIVFIKQSLSELPTLRRVFDEGAFYPLQSSAEYTSASIWPSFYTGQMPGEHGVSQHIQWDAQAMRMRRLASDWFYCEPFWYDLERRGLKVCTVDVPFTYPSRIKNGVEVMNWGSHDLMGKFECRPAALGSEIRRKFGKHPMGYEIPVNKSKTEVQMLYDQLIAGAKRKAQLLKWMTTKVEWDFFLGVFGECHRGGHILWPAKDDPSPVVPDGALLEVYRQVDAGLGEVLEGIDREKTTVIVFALHGMRSNFSQEHFIRRIMDRVNERFQDGTNGSHGSEHAAKAPKPQSGLIRKLRESIPPSLQFAIARSVPVGVRDWVVGREVTGGVDWANTRGFALRSDVHSFVRFNIAGREREGILAAGSDEHRAYQDWVIQNIMALKESGTDEPIVKDVIPAHEAMPGPRSELLPDLIIRWAHRKRAKKIYSEELGEISAEPETGRTGEHRMNGFAVILNSDGEMGELPELGHNTHFPKVVRHLLDCDTPA